MALTQIPLPRHCVGRHADQSTLAWKVAARLRPEAFFQWMLIVCMGLVLWPTQFGGAFGMVIVAGNSMEPTYNLGDAVITWREPIGVGDIVLFQVPEGDFGERNAVIHRIVGGGPNGWTTKGDNSFAEDHWRPTSDDIVGVAQLRIPLGGRALGLMRNWLFISALGGLAVGLFLWSEPEEADLRAPKHLQSRRVGRKSRSWARRA